MAVSPFPCPTCVSDLVSVFTCVSVASQPPQVTHLQGPRGNQNMPSSFLLPVQSKEAEGGCLGSSLTPSCVRVLAAQSQPPPGARALIGSPLAAQNRCLSRCNFFFRSVLQLLLPGGHTVWRAVLRGRHSTPISAAPLGQRGGQGTTTLGWGGSHVSLQLQFLTPQAHTAQILPPTGLYPQNPLDIQGLAQQGSSSRHPRDTCYSHPSCDHPRMHIQASQHCHIPEKVLP